jgi:hypothetical protein
VEHSHVAIRNLDEQIHNETPIICEKASSSNQESRSKTFEKQQQTASLSPSSRNLLARLLDVEKNSLLTAVHSSQER